MILFISLKPDNAIFIILEDGRCVVIKIASGGCNEVIAHPIKLSQDFPKSVACLFLELVKLFFRVSVVVSHVMMSSTKGNHSLRVIMILRSPRGVKVVPG